MTLSRTDPMELRSFGSFLGQDQLNLLQNFIRTQAAKEKDLVILTDAAALPSETVLDCLRRFNGVDLRLVVRGIGVHFDYHRRRGACWSEVLENIEMLQKIAVFRRIQVQIEVDVFNIHYLPNQLLFWAQRDFGVLVCPKADREQFDGRTLPWMLKQRVIRKYRELSSGLPEEARVFLQSIEAHMVSVDYSERWAECLRFIWRQDQGQRLRFQNVFPEFYLHALDTGVWHYYESAAKTRIPANAPQEVRS